MTRRLRHIIVSQLLALCLALPVMALAWVSGCQAAGGRFQGARCLGNSYESLYVVVSPAGVVAMAAFYLLCVLVCYRLCGRWFDRSRDAQQR